MDVTKYIGKPYSTAGSGPDGFDCYGLAQTIAADRGFALPNQRTAAGVSMRHAVFSGEGSRWLNPIEVPEPWSIVFFVIAGLPHVGTMIDEPGKFIHVGEMTESVRLDRLDSTFYKNPYGFYRTICRIRPAAARPA